MKNLFILLLFISIFTGCVTQQRCNRKFPPEAMIIRKDSIIRETKTIYNDTTIIIRIPGEQKINTEYVYIKDDQIYFKPSYLKTGFAESRAFIENKKLMHTLTQNDTLLSIKLNNAIRLTWDRAAQYYSVKENNVITAFKIPVYAKILSLLGVLFIIYICFKIRSIFKL